MQRRRPSWGYMPPGFSFREAGRVDRVRVLAIVGTLIVMFLAGASDLAR
jgi:hypothetical protein